MSSRLFLFGLTNNILCQSANADTLLGQDWAVALKKQVVAFLLANLDTVGVRQKSEDGAPVRMLDYACGPGTVSLVSVRASQPS